MSDPDFWRLIDKAGDCWEWRGTRDPHGYGRLNRRAIRRSPILAHRYSWFLATGELPPSHLYVCHRCDNPPCVRPDHLFLGTAADNNADRDAKGRTVPPPRHGGETHPQVAISDAEVRAARESYAAGREFQFEIGERLGVPQTVVGKWVRGEVRLDAGGPIVKPRKRATRAEMAARRGAA